MRSERASCAYRALWLAAALLLAVLPAHAQWKWKDGKGQTHISDLPPPRDIPEKDVLQRPAEIVRKTAAAGAASAPEAAPAASAAAATKPRVDPEIEARRTRIEQEQKAKAKADEDKLAAQRAENCARAKQQLAGVESGMRLARVNDKGEREILDDKARAEEAQRARQAIASECR